MNNQALRKLRYLCVGAYSKINLRAGDHRPGKWPEDGFTRGRRDWLETPIRFLIDKLDEEVTELKAAVEEEGNSIHVMMEAADVAAVAMMVVDRYIKTYPTIKFPEHPRVVCLCGSTKFKEQFIQANFDETMRGNIVLSVGWFSHADKKTYQVTEEEKRRLDQLHMRKIDLADEILVINVGGYIGDSTRREIDYATMTGKEVRYLEPAMPPVL